MRPIDVRLLLDEHLSPQLVEWCAKRRGIYALAVPHVGLAGVTDGVIWQYAFDHDCVVVTINARDFLELLDVELHPGLIVIRESGLSRDEQWNRLGTALDYIAGQAEPDTYMINRVIEVMGPSRVVDHQIPPSPSVSPKRSSFRADWRASSFWQA